VADTDKIKQEMGFSPRYDIRRTIAEFAGTAPLSLAAETLPDEGSPPRHGGLHV
jgi:hypothetical protein